MIVTTDLCQDGRQAIRRALETGKQELSITTAPALALKHIDKGTA